MNQFFSGFSFTRQHVYGVMFALLSAIGFSAKAIFVKLAYLESVDAITLLALRMAFAVPFFVLAIWFGSRNSQRVPMQQRDWLAVLVLGFIGYYLASFLDFLGLQYISAGLERLILFLYPTMVVLISAMVFRQRIGRTVILALLLSYAGIVLVFLHDFNVQPEDGVLMGSSLVFASALAYAVYLVGAGHTIARIGAMRFTAYAMTVACLAALLQFVLTHSLDGLMVQSGRVYGLSLAMALFSTVLPAFALAAAMRRIGSMQTSLIGAIGPVATIYLAYWFLGETLSLIQFAGSVLVLAGVLMISLRQQKN
ncbi:DMT family transporter [Methylobacillus gramineus]|uniref:DMT family transporter n=1 Tax=Methylobacillus gramineus TaxID=755169 RepID=UPI001CFFF280|nr:DMT family transporter [Methylobacillus gramineus]MCB5185990.1 DMT family transporter [Methylobacillus gramineus]